MRLTDVKTLYIRGMNDGDPRPKVRPIFVACILCTVVMNPAVPTSQAVALVGLFA